MTSKACFKCNTTKSSNDFYKHSAMSDGYFGKCKECTKSDAIQHRWANIEKIREYDRTRSLLPHRMDLHAKVTKQYVADFPERKRANSKVAYALKVGKLHKHPCLVCGLSAVAHHPDYDRPLDVIWLCQPHHKQAHALI